MAASIKQGDAYALPISIKLNGDALGAEKVETVEICVGNVRKTYPGDVRYDSSSGEFIMPITQSESFAFHPYDAVSADVRVKLCSGDVIGARRLVYITVIDAKSEVII